MPSEDGTQRLRDGKQAMPELHSKWTLPSGWPEVQMTQFTPCRKWQVKSLVSGTLRGLRGLRAPEAALRVFQGVGKHPPWGAGSLALERPRVGAPPGAGRPPCPGSAGRSRLDRHASSAGVDDGESECGLDNFGDFDWVIENDGDEQRLEEQLGNLTEFVHSRL